VNACVGSFASPGALNRTDALVSEEMKGLSSAAVIVVSLRKILGRTPGRIANYGRKCPS
jgi:hypothetical protein